MKKMSLSKDKKQLIKYMLIRISYFIFSYSKNRIYVSMLNKNNITGPGRFLFNLEKGLQKYKIQIERRLLSRCDKVLIISSAPNSFYKFCKRKKIKLILRIDGFSLPIYYNNKGIRHLDYNRIKTNQNMQIGLLHSDYVIFQSSFSREMSDKYLYNRKDRYSIIHNGVNINHFKPNSSRNRSTLKLGVLGLLRDTDIISLSLESFKMISIVQKNVELWFIGTIKNDVLSFIKDWKETNSNISKNIKILGQTGYNVLPEVLNKVDISLHLTSGDWCPNAILENLSSGNPVICFDYGGAKELVGEAGLAIKCSPYDYSSKNIPLIVKAIKKINNNLTSYSKLARKRAINKFSLDIMVTKYKEIFDKL